MSLGVYEIGGRERRDNTLLCGECSERWSERLDERLECVDGVEAGECDGCGKVQPGNVNNS